MLTMDDAKRDKLLIDILEIRKDKEELSIKMMGL